MSASELKFLVDVDVGKKVEEYLLEKRYDPKAVRSLDQRMPDQEIIRLAALEKRIVITMLKRFPCFRSIRPRPYEIRQVGIESECFYSRRRCER
jgi:predicted nuclease of predicted toxin-antitoxin system